MNRFRRALYIFRLALLIVGPTFMAVGVGSILYSAWFTTATTRVAGKVVALTPQESSNVDPNWIPTHQITYLPVFTFATTEGKTFSAQGSVASNPPEFTVGQTVPVLYKTANPQRARISTFSQQWGMGTFFSCFGSVVLAIGWGWSWLQAKQSRSRS